MPAGLNRQEQNKLNNRLVLENIRRVLFASLASIVVIPILLVLNKYFADDAIAQTMSGALTIFEVISVLSVIMSYMLLQSKNIAACKLAYRSFWVVFEIFSFLVVYSNIMSGARTTFYAIMLAALMLAPIMGMGEQMYYIVIQLVYAAFLLVKFGVNMNDVVNVAILNIAFFGASRIIYRSQIERYALRARQKEANETAHLDRLTGLLNRDGLEKRLSSVVDDCVRSHKRISLLLVDIDELSEYNSAFGNSRGDDCIRVVSGEIRKMSMRNTDILARLEAGRFVIVLEGGDDIGPVRLAERIRQAVYGRRIIQSRHASTECVSVSIGVASGVPRSQREFYDLYDEADDALLEAKERGRNVTIYDEQMYGRAPEVGSRQRRTAY